MGGLLAALSAVVADVIYHLGEHAMTSIKEQIETSANEIQNVAEKGAVNLAAGIAGESRALAALAGAGYLADILAGVVASTTFSADDKESLRTLKVNVDRELERLAA
jgi:hypothetical protein